MLGSFFARVFIVNALTWRIHEWIARVSIPTCTVKSWTHDDWHCVGQLSQLYCTALRD